MVFRRRGNISLMNRKKLRQLAKKINNGKEVNIKFIFTNSDHFSYSSENNSLEISSFYYKLNKQKLCGYLTHEIGHMNTEKKAIMVLDYQSEYDANRWAMYRLDELGWKKVSSWYENYLYEMSRIEIKDELDEEYQQAATDLILDLGLT